MNMMLLLNQLPLGSTKSSNQLLNLDETDAASHPNGNDAGAKKFLVDPRQFSNPLQLHGASGTACQKKSRSLKLGLPPTALPIIEFCQAGQFL
jgi:hypothetical protein